MAKKRLPKGDSSSRSGEGVTFLRSRVFRQVVLTFAAVVLLILYFSIPLYHHWFQEKIIRYYKEFPHQWHTRDLDTRWMERHGYNYYIPKLIARQTPDSAVVLLPPRDYVKEYFSPMVYYWQSAIWNYYFFGPRRYITYRSPEQDFSGVTYAVVIHQSEIKLIFVDKPGVLPRILAEFASK